MSDQFPNRRQQEITSGRTQTLGLDYNVAALLCYLPLPPLNLAAALLWLISEPKANLFVRFHAIQSLMYLGIFVALNIVVGFIGSLGGIPVIGWLFAVISGILWFGVSAIWLVGSVLLIIKAKDREMYKLPYLGDLAEQYAAK